MIFSDTPSLCIKILSKRRMYNQPKEADTTMQVMCAETVVCPPETGKFIIGLVPDNIQMVAMVTGKTAQVLIPRRVTQVSGGKLSIWVVNDHKYPVILKQRVNIAVIEGIDQVYESSRDESYDSELNDREFSHFNDFSNECHDAHTLHVFSSDCFCVCNADFGYSGDGFGFDSSLGLAHSNCSCFSDFDDFTDGFDEHFGTTDLGYNDDDFDLFPTVSTDVFPISTPSGESCIAKAKLDHLGSHRSSQMMAVLQRHSALFDESAPLGKVPNIKHHIPTADTDPIRTRQ